MSRDALTEAARALRESAEQEAPRADETRARVMASLRAEQARRLVILRVAVPLAAVLVGSFAWAAAAGKLPAPVSGLFAPRLLESPATQHRPMPSAGGAAIPPEPTIPAPAEEPSSAPTAAPGARGPAGNPPAEGARAFLDVVPGPERAPPGVGSRPRGDPRAAAVPSDPASAADAEDEALYTRAHRLHFVDRDPGAALQAWDAYLRAFPRGRLALESRYNRALCLVRLGRRDEARAALAGFAKGAYGAYRQAEARALVEAMESAPP